MVANDFMGVPGGLRVRLTINYLSLATAWKAQLPAGVQADLDAGSKGPYKGFPQYSTADISLTAPQVTLLAAMSTWVVENNRELYEAALLGGGAARGGAGSRQ